MIHGSLESGLGGFDYAAEMLGWYNVFHCEINPFCQKILKHYWPNAKTYTDIFEFDGKPWAGRIDIITAGFPCQPFSHAGKRKGSKDERFIWPENMRIFREVKPRFIVAENVPGLLTIERGLVFEQVCADLENEGYEVQAFIIPACAKDAVHRRDRVWIVANCKHFGNGWRKQQQKSEYEATESILQPIAANNSNTGLPQRQQSRESGPSKKDGTGLEHRITNTDRDAADAECIRQPEPGEPDKSGSTKESREGKTNIIINNSEQYAANCNRPELQGHGQPGERRRERLAWPGAEQEAWFEAATRLCSVDDELAGRLDVAAISKSKWRTESLKAYGNAIYWPVAYEIFKAIEETENKYNG